MTEELKQKAEQFAEKHAFRVPYDGSNNFYDDTDYRASKDGYIAGATEATKELQEELTEKDKQIEDLKAINVMLQTAVGDFSDLQDKLDEEQRKSRGLEEENEQLEGQVTRAFEVLESKRKQIDYAKSIIKSLLDNSDEYAKQRAREFLKE